MEHITLAIKLTQDENLVATKIPPYQELLSQVSASNEQQDYERTIKILDEDIADRTPDEQRKALNLANHGVIKILQTGKKAVDALVPRNRIYLNKQKQINNAIRLMKRFG